ALAFDPAHVDLPIAQHPSQFRLHIEATAALEREAVRRGGTGRQTGLAIALLEAFEQLGVA
ncbi:hypothetical protein LTR94_030734, partial [Friedmanniomyces endolithicus]